MGEEETKAAGGVAFIDNAYAPEVFATNAAGFFVLEGVIGITLESVIADHSPRPGPIRRVVRGRLTMPIAGAQRLALGLIDFLKNQGLDPVEAITRGETVQ